MRHLTMTRLKFAIFALVALGLWAYQLVVTSPLIAAGAFDRASSALAAVPTSLALHVEAQRSALHAAALRAAESPAALVPGTKALKPEAPTADRLGAIRAVAIEALPPELRDQLQVALATEGGLLWQGATGEPSAAAPAGVDLAAVMAAGAQGALLTIAEAPHFALSISLMGLDRGEVKPVGTAVFALPLLSAPQAVVDVAAKDLDAVGIVVDGKLLASAGAAKGTLVKVMAGRAGEAVSLTEGGASLGPIALPVMVTSPPQDVGLRAPIAGTPFEVVAIATLRSEISALVGYQKFALLGLVGLLLLGLGVLVLLGESVAAPSMVVSPPMPVVSTLPKPAAKPVPEPMPSPPASQVAEASPDDFKFPSRPDERPPTPAVDPFTSSSPSSAAVNVSSPFSNNDFGSSFGANDAIPLPGATTNPQPVDEDSMRTMAYPAYKPPPPVGDPFAMVAPPTDESDGDHGEGDSTRVATVPQELMAAARGSAPTAPNGKAVAAPPPAKPPFEEEKHFQDIFREFVALREKCGEAADGLTYEKFKAKLLKNKEQLIQKYACKAVRFQVYVKEGKAALKATPLKE